MTMMKYLILVGDGMGDYPLAELGDRTPLEAADTPAMDRLCRKGELFLTKTVPDGYAPGSDVANLSLMGYDPVQYYTGRAPLEAASMGISLADDETAYRCNLVTLDRVSDEKTIMVDFTAGHISTEEAAELIKSLEAECGNDQFRFHSGVSYRHLLIHKGEPVDLTTAPPHDYIQGDVSHLRQAYLATPKWVDLIRKAERVLAEHPVNIERKNQDKKPANAIWPWGEGKMPAMPTFQQRFRLRGSMISAVDLLKGIGVNAGLQVVDVPGATGYLDTNYAGKVAAALDTLEQLDFTFVHVEAPDECGHQGSVDKKIKAIEDFDTKIVHPIIEGLEKMDFEYRLVVTMDHFTPISLRTHSSDMVPTLLYDSRQVGRGSGLPFSESSTADKMGSMILEPGHLLIKKLLER